jgi:hypothetical protein
MDQGQCPAKSGLSPVGEWLVATACSVAGLTILALAVGVIPYPPGQPSAPRWVIGLAACLFIAGGWVPMAVRWGAESWKSRLVGAGVLLPLTTVFNWIAFGPGPRVFSGGMAVAGSAATHGAVPESIGRIAFGVVAVLLDVWVVVIVVKWMRGNPR